MYIHQLPDWPSFRWDNALLDRLVANLHYRRDLLVDHVRLLKFDFHQEVILQTLTSDVLKSSEIEGERLSPKQVRFSIARRLGMNTGATRSIDPNIEGIVGITLDAMEHSAQPLTTVRLFEWHRALFPTGYSGFREISIGEWRRDQKGPMQVVSGPIGRERVHFEAPAAERIDREMNAFLDWFNGSANLDPLMKAGLAHLWFVAIHPFDDGNGRLTRAIADMALARSENRPKRFYSMSAQIRQERTDYYKILEQTQKGNMDVTSWMEWFLACMHRAIDRAEMAVNATERM